MEYCIAVAAVAYDMKLVVVVAACDVMCDVVGFVVAAAAFAVVAHQIPHFVHHFASTLEVAAMAAVWKAIIVIKKAS